MARMARKRMIHPEIWSDGKVVTLTTPEFITFVGFVSHADDEGLSECSVSVHYWRICRGDLTMEQVGSAIDKLSNIGMIIRHPTDSGLCVLPNWFKYQSLNRPTQTKHKRLPSTTLPPSYLSRWQETFKCDYPEPSDDSLSTHCTVTEDSPLVQVSLEEVSLDKVRLEKNSCSNPPSTKSSEREKAAYPTEFEKWYAEYPRKQAKGAALKAWQKAIKLTTNEKLIAAAKAFAESDSAKDMQFIPHPATWLNDCRYDDDPKSWKKNNQGANNGKPAKRGGLIHGTDWNAVTGTGYKETDM